MKCQNKKWEKDGFVLREFQKEDAEEYYRQNFNPLDKELIYYTGSKENFTREEVVGFFLNCIKAEDRYDFLIISPDGRIVGESVINEIDWKNRNANFRIGIFHEEERGKGIGSWVIAKTRDFAFEELKLHRLGLEVFSYNVRARRAYETAGFVKEGVLREAVLDREGYADIIIMSILEDDWRAWKIG